MDEIVPPPPTTTNLGVEALSSNTLENVAVLEIGPFRDN